jgi:hypothetical protein
LGRGASALFPFETKEAKMFDSHLGVYPEIEFSGKLHADPVENDRSNIREVHAWFDLREFNGGRDAAGKSMVSLWILVSGWTNEICDQILTLRKGDEVEIKASVMTLGTFRKSETPYLRVFARFVHKVGDEHSWPAKIERLPAVH